MFVVLKAHFGNSCSNQEFAPYQSTKERDIDSLRKIKLANSSNKKKNEQVIKQYLENQKNWIPKNHQIPGFY